MEVTEQEVRYPRDYRGSDLNEILISRLENTMQAAVSELRAMRSVMETAVDLMANMASNRPQESLAPGRTNTQVRVPAEKKPLSPVVEEQVLDLSGSIAEPMEHSSQAAKRARSLSSSPEATAAETQPKRGKSNEVDDDIQLVLGSPTVTSLENSLEDAISELAQKHPPKTHNKQKPPKEKVSHEETRNQEPARTTQEPVPVVTRKETEPQTPTEEQPNNMPAPPPPPMPSCTPRTSRRRSKRSKTEGRDSSGSRSRRSRSTSRTSETENNSRVPAPLTIVQGEDSVNDQSQNSSTLEHPPVTPYRVHMGNMPVLSTAPIYMLPLDSPSEKNSQATSTTNPSPAQRPEEEQEGERSSCRTPSPADGIHLRLGDEALEAFAEEVSVSDINLYFKNKNNHEEAKKQMQNQGKVPFKTVLRLLREELLLMIINNPVREMTRVMTRAVYDQLIPEEFWMKHEERWAGHFGLNYVKEKFSSVLQQVVRTSEKLRERFPQNKEGILELEKFLLARKKANAEQAEIGFFSQPSQSHSQLENSYSEDIQLE